MAAITGNAVSDKSKLDPQKTKRVILRLHLGGDNMADSPDANLTQSEPNQYRPVDWQKGEVGQLNCSSVRSRNVFSGVNQVGVGAPPRGGKSEKPLLTAYSEGPIFVN